MRNYGNLLTLVFKAVALGMAVASLVLGILGTVSVDTMVTLLSIGLLSLALAALQSGPEPE